MITEITSTQNPRVKNLALLLSKSKVRKERRSFLIEGKREIERALKTGWTMLELWSTSESWLRRSKARPVGGMVLTNEAVFQKLAYRSGVVDTVAVFEMPDTTPKDWSVALANHPAVLVLEGIEKPGNLGAVMRSAVAAGIKAIILADSRVDPFNPNVVRNATGALFELAVYHASSAELLEILPGLGYAVYTTKLGADSSDVFATEYSSRSAFVFGTEAHGLTPLWDSPEVHNILIPMYSATVDSLNISVSAAVVAFDWSRKFHGK